MINEMYLIKEIEKVKEKKDEIEKRLLHVA